MHKKFMRSLKAAIAFTLVFSISIPALAASEKEQTQQNLAALQNEKAALQNRLSQLQANKSDTQSYIVELDSELTAVGDEIERIQGELNDTQADLEKTQADLNAAKEKETEQYAALKARIKAMYEKGDTSLMEVFMNAEDISTLLNATEYISRISDYDAQLLTALNETRKEIESLEAQLQTKKEELETLKTQEESKKDELEMVMDAKRAELEQLGASINEVTAQIYNTQAEIDTNNQILAAIQKAEAEAAERQRQAEEAQRQREAELAAQQQESGNTQTGDAGSTDETQATAPESTGETAAPGNRTGSHNTGEPAGICSFRDNRCNRTGNHARGKRNPGSGK